MGQKIYGIDLSKKFNTKDVRDAIIKCFIQAHKEVLKTLHDNSLSKKEMKEMEELSVELLIKSKMKENGSNFKNPTKEDLIKLCNSLAEYAKTFRNEKIIKKNYSSIMKLIEKL